MRNAIKEYLSYSEDEKRDLWNHATFVFDTNVLLNLYRYTDKTRNILLSALVGLKDRLWMPNHVAHEFMKNRNNVIWETNHQYETLQSEAEKYINLCRTTLKLEQNDDELEGLKNNIFTWINAAKEKNVVVTTSCDDSILEQLLTIYDGKVGHEIPSEKLKEIEKNGKERYAAEVPPGYKDAGKQKGENKNNIYGDLIVWKEIIDYASTKKKDIVFVTNDQKEDWWEILHNQTIGPRVELRREFSESTSQRFHMYTIRSFITHLENDKDVKVDKGTIDEIESFLNVSSESLLEKYLRDYYYDSDGELDENRVRQTYYEIMKLEFKNRKRLKAISNINEKYQGKIIPEDVETMLEQTIANLERDETRIKRLQEELVKINYTIAK